VRLLSGETDRIGDPELLRLSSQTAAKGTVPDQVQEDSLGHLLLGLQQAPGLQQTVDPFDANQIADKQHATLFRSTRRCLLLVGSRCGRTEHAMVHTVREGNDLVGLDAGVNHVALQRVTRAEDQRRRMERLEYETPETGLPDANPEIRAVHAEGIGQTSVPE
jgi:hypothetical protein